MLRETERRSVVYADMKAEWVIRSTLCVSDKKF